MEGKKSFFSFKMGATKSKAECYGYTLFVEGVSEKKKQLQKKISRRFPPLSQLPAGLKDDLIKQTICQQGCEKNKTKIKDLLARKTETLTPSVLCKLRPRGGVMTPTTRCCPLQL